MNILCYSYIATKVVSGNKNLLIVVFFYWSHSLSLKASLLPLNKFIK